MRTAILRFLVVTSVCSTALAAQSGVRSAYLSGHVYKSGGKPLAGARISLFPLEVGVSGAMPMTISKKDGSYYMICPAYGKTLVFASLEDLGYPDVTAKVFSSPAIHFPEVNLVAGATLDNVDIRLGPPDGIVEGSVVDRDSGKAVRFARITLRWPDEPSVFRSANSDISGHFQYALPKRPISITISASGYRTWTYTDPSTHEGYILLGPHERRSITVKMIRIGAHPSAQP